MMLSRLHVQAGCMDNRCSIRHSKHALASRHTVRHGMLSHGTSLQQLSAVKYDSQGHQDQSSQQDAVGSHDSNTPYTNSWRSHAFLTLPQEDWQATEHMTSEELVSMVKRAEQQGLPLPTIAIDGNAAARWLYPEKDWDRPMSGTMRHFLEGAGKDMELTMCDSAFNSFLLLAPPDHRTRAELIKKLQGKGIKIDNLPLDVRYATIDAMEEKMPTIHATISDGNEHGNAQQQHLRDVFIVNHAARTGAILVTADSRAIACPAVKTCWDVTCSA